MQGNMGLWLKMRCLIAVVTSWPEVAERFGDCPVNLINADSIVIPLQCKTCLLHFTFFNNVIKIYFRTVQFTNLIYTLQHFLKIFFWCGPFLKSLLNLLQYCFCFMFWYFGHEACGILAPQPGIEPAPLALEGGFLSREVPLQCFLEYSKSCI